MNTLLTFSRAMANDKRLEILALLKEPALHFDVDQYDEVEGVCGLYIAEKIGIAPPTASVHLKILQQAGLLSSVRIGKFTYFKRNPAALLQFAEAVRSL